MPEPFQPAMATCRAILHSSTLPSLPGMALTARGRGRFQTCCQVVALPFPHCECRFLSWGFPSRLCLWCFKPTGVQADPSARIVSGWGTDRWAAANCELRCTAQGTGPSSSATPQSILEPHLTGHWFWFSLVGWLESGALYIPFLRHPQDFCRPPPDLPAPRAAMFNQYATAHGYAANDPQVCQRSLGGGHF